MYERFASPTISSNETFVSKAMSRVKLVVSALSASHRKNFSRLSVNGDGSVRPTWCSLRPRYVCKGIALDRIPRSRETDSDFPLTSAFIILNFVQPDVDR